MWSPMPTLVARAADFFAAVRRPLALAAGADSRAVVLRADFVAPPPRAPAERRPLVALAPVRFVADVRPADFPRVVGMGSSSGERQNGNRGCTRRQRRTSLDGSSARISRR